MRLPIDSLLPDIVSKLRHESLLVIEAPPGAGKTTRVPPALLDAGLAGDKQIVVLQPRRIAARMAARRIAAERGTRVGEEIGFQVRFERAVSSATRIVLMTEGLLLRRLLQEPSLESVGIVVLDEIHERNAPADVALALLRGLQHGRPDLKLVLMSATIQSASIAETLGCTALSSEGRLHPIEIQHAEQVDDRRLEDRVASALRRIATNLDGDVLVFLPGVAEILRAAAACAPIAKQRGLDVVPLYGGLSADAQDRAVQPGTRPRVILSTNVAETSVTIPGVVAVIDTGLARRPAYDPASGLDTLQTRPVSRASAVQRAGRAGRVRAGTCVRLYTRHDFEARPESERPEILRAELSEIALLLDVAGVTDPASVDWLDAPPGAAWDAADVLLRALGARDEAGITEVGRRMAALPLHPRLARLVVEGARRGVLEEACWLAAIPAERSPRTDRQAQASVKSDLLDIAEDVRRVATERFDPVRLRDLGLAAGPARAIAGAARQLVRLSRGLDATPRPSGDDAVDEALLRAVLAGYPDRVAQRRDRNTVQLCTGKQVQVAPSSGVRDAAWLVAVTAERRDRRAPRLTIASAIEPEWLLDASGEWLADETTLRFDVQRERVEEAWRLRYGALTLDESVGPPGDAEAAAAVLAEAARKRGVEAFLPAGALARLRARLGVAGAASGVSVPALDDAEVERALAALCRGCTSFADVRDASLIDALTHGLDHDVQRALRELAPDTIALPGGRTLRVEYEADKPPWVQSWLQDFFGMSETPRLGGRTAVTLHLLAPNRRPVQVTNDLAGFWDKHYPALRRQLSRRYPKHDWPEDPVHAAPPPPGGRRRRRR